MFKAAVFWMVPNSAPVLVPEPVTNAPMAPMSGATKGKYCPRVSTKNSAMVFVMPEYDMSLAQARTPIIVMMVFDICFTVAPRTLKKSFTDTFCTSAPRMPARNTRTPGVLSHLMV